MYRLSYVLFVCVCQVVTERQQEATPISAPVVYKDLMLIITDESRITAIVFDDEIDASFENGLVTEKGVKYRFRSYEIEGGKKTGGAGKLVEKVKKVPSKNPKVIAAVDDGSILHFENGKTKLKWTYQAPGRGWVYYYPEKIRIQIAHREDFDKIALERFKK